VGRPADLTRVVVLEDHQLFAESLVITLRLAGHQVERLDVARSSTLAALVAATLRLRPQVVLLDLDLGPHHGLQLVQPLDQGGVAVLVLTGISDPARLGECLHLGARGTVTKTGPLEGILAAIEAVRQGRSALPAAERERLLAAFEGEREVLTRIRAALETLTWREGVVLGHLMVGVTVRDIARTSNVAEGTVRSQVKSVLAKLGVSSQLAAVGAAHTVHWRPPADAGVPTLQAQYRPVD
jgi:two-component system, NarL family, nitrate/nitrite response regulator NarL